MPATATIVGGGLGFCMQMYINALRKLPLLRSASPAPPPPEPRSARFRVCLSLARDAPEAFRGPHAPSRASPTRIPPSRARIPPPTLAEPERPADPIPQKSFPNRPVGARLLDRRGRRLRQLELGVGGEAAQGG